jgi:hypothetical protein
MDSYGLIGAQLMSFMKTQPLELIKEIIKSIVDLVFAERIGDMWNDPKPNVYGDLFTTPYIEAMLFAMQPEKEGSVELFVDFNIGIIRLYGLAFSLNAKDSLARAEANLGRTSVPSDGPRHVQYALHICNAQATLISEIQQFSPEFAALLVRLDTLRQAFLAENEKDLKYCC